MKAYKLEILVIDHDEVGPEELKHLIENARYPNRCISPEVKAIEERDIGEWHDGHPLNFNNQAGEEYYRELFSKNKPKGERMEWKNYVKQAKQPMRPYKPGEDLEAQGVSVWDGDTIEPGGMIARNPDNPDDQWYVAKDFFDKNYKPAD